MKFTQTHTDFRTGKPQETVSIEIAEHSDLSTVFDAFSRFLKAAGYEFDGNVDIVNDQDDFNYFEDSDDSFDSTNYDEDQAQSESPIEGFTDTYKSSDWPFPTRTKP